MAQEENLKLVVKCHDNEVYGDLYGFNKEIPEEELEKVKPYMEKFSPKSFKDIMNVFGIPYGWMCTSENVEKVEEALNITETVAKQEEKQRKDKEKYDKNRIKKEDAQWNIERIFMDAPRPRQKLDILLRVAQYVYDPVNSFRDNNYYGGGYLFIVTKRSIWYIMNNGRSENNWHINNIEIEGAGGAIGFRVDYSEQLHEYIKILTENNLYSGETYVEEEQWKKKLNP